MCEVPWTIIPRTASDVRLGEAVFEVILAIDIDWNDLEVKRWWLKSIMAKGHFNGGDEVWERLTPHGRWSKALHEHVCAIADPGSPEADPQLIAAIEEAVKIETDEYEWEVA